MCFTGIKENVCEVLYCERIRAVMKGAAWSFLPGEFFFFHLLNTFESFQRYSLFSRYIVMRFYFPIFSTLTDWWCLENSLQFKIFNQFLWFCPCVILAWYLFLPCMIFVCSRCSYPFYQIQGKGQRSHIGLQSPKLLSLYFLSDQSTCFPTPISLSNCKRSRHITVSGLLLLDLLFPQTECGSLITSFKSLNKHHLKEDFL